jgi:hypothetical protein
MKQWESQEAITQSTSFLWFKNYSSQYIKGYAELVAGLQEKLKVPRDVGKKGSMVAITWTEEDQKNFEEVKRVLCSGLVLQRVNPDKDFILRVDASQYAIGATLEQLFDEDRKPTIEDVQNKKTVPVAFWSRKLTTGQRKWVTREQETYAIVEALRKWRSVLGVQPITIFTDHKALEEWYNEEVETPSCPTGRRLRWHETLSDHDLTVQYIPGKDNILADAMSRWAYPASKGYRDISRHGSAKDAEDVKEIIRQEKEEEANAIYKVNSQGANATVLQNCAQAVAPVGAKAESSASPPERFTFRDPAEGPSEWARRRPRYRGRESVQRARQGRGLPRKSPPSRR